MPSAVYLHDGEHQITVTFRTEQDRERFKAHYRTLDATGLRFMEERDAARRANERLARAIVAARAVIAETMRPGSRSVITAEMVALQDALRAHDAGGTR